MTVPHANFQSGHLRQTCFNRITEYVTKSSLYSFRCRKCSHLKPAQNGQQVGCFDFAYGDVPDEHRHTAQKHGPLILRALSDTAYFDGLFRGARNRPASDPHDSEPTSRFLPVPSWKGGGGVPGNRDDSEWPRSFHREWDRRPDLLSSPPLPNDA